MIGVDVSLTRGQRSMRFALRTETAVTGVYGPSGGGKTTLLHVIAGLLRPEQGTVQIGSEVVVDVDRGVYIPAHRRQIGVVFQDGRLFPHYSVRGNLRYARATRGAPTRAPAPGFDEVVDVLALGGLLSRRVHTLSGGERQRVALGRALLAAPRLLLLDEPLASVDRGARQTILDHMIRVRDVFGIPMLYVAHDLSEIRRLTDSLVVVDDGRVIAAGAPAAIAERPDAWALLREAENVLRVEVAGHDAAAGLTRFTLSGVTPPVTVVGPIAEVEVGRAASLAVRASDIVLAREEVRGISIRNQRPARVVRLIPQPDRVVVEIDIGQSLLVEVSHQTVQTLELAPGADRWCLIKSNALKLIDHLPRNRFPA